MTRKRHITTAVYVCLEIYRSRNERLWRPVHDWQAALVCFAGRAVRRRRGKNCIQRVGRQEPVAGKTTARVHNLIVTITMVKLCCVRMLKWRITAECCGQVSWPASIMAKIWQTAKSMRIAGTFFAHHWKAIEILYYTDAIDLILLFTRIVLNWLSGTARRYTSWVYHIRCPYYIIHWVIMVSYRQYVWSRIGLEFTGAG